MILVTGDQQEGVPERENVSGGNTGRHSVPRYLAAIVDGVGEHQVEARLSGNQAIQVEDRPVFPKEGSVLAERADEGIAHDLAVDIDGPWFAQAIAAKV